MYNPKDSRRASADATAPPATSSGRRTPAPRRPADRTLQVVTGGPEAETSDDREVVHTDRIRDRYAADEHGHYRVTRTQGEDREGNPVTHVTRKEIVSARVRIAAAYADDTGEPYPISATEVPDRLRPTVTHYDLTVSRPDDGSVDLADVPAEAFAKVEWVERAELADLQVVTAGGQTAKHDITTAIRLSSPHPVVPAYGRLGWHYRGGEWLYIHGGGAWSAAGAVPSVRVHGDGLGVFTMAPPPQDDAAGRRAFEALWGLFDMGPDRFAAVEVGAAFRASMGRPSGSVTYRAVNQSGKSGRMAFITQCWAPSVRWNRLPFNAGKMFATPTYIEHVHHTFGDMLVPWDDMAPVGSPRERMDYFDMFARSLFNGASKGRMGIQDRRIVARARLRPRAFGALSAEDLTAVESGQNRTHLILLSREEFDGAAFEAADTGTGPEDRSALMSAFVVWWAARMPAHAYVADLEAQYRAELAKATGAPGRYIESAADKAAGLHCGLEFAQDRGWVDPERAAGLWKRAWAGLCESLCAQVDANAGQSMADRIRNAILDGLSAREAHVIGVDGAQPARPGEFGWEGEFARGRMVGWTDSSRLYLLPSSAAAFVADFSMRAGSPIEVTSRAMGEALEAAGYITGSDENRGGRIVHRHTVAVKVQGQKKNAWVLPVPVDSEGPEGGPKGPQDGPEVPAAPAAGPPICQGYTSGKLCGQPLMFDDGTGRHVTCEPEPSGFGVGTLGADDWADAPTLPSPSESAGTAISAPSVTEAAPAEVEDTPAPAGRPQVKREPRIARSIADRVAEALGEAGGDPEAATAALIKRAIPDSVELLEEVRATGRYEFTAHPPTEPEILRKRGRQANQIWEARPNWTNTAVPAGTEVDRLDTNAAYLSALNTHLPIGVLVHTEGPEFNRRRSGLYRITPPEWTHADLPNPLGNREEGGPLWVTRPTLQLLCDLATEKYGALCAAPVIHESWTSGSSESLLRQFRDMLRDARAEAIRTGDDVTLEYIKPMYSKFVSTMIKESRFNHWIERSDWPHIIRAQAHGNLWRKALKAHQAGLTVYRAVGTDELHVVGEWRSVWAEGRALAEMKLKDVDGDGGTYRVGE